MGAAQQFDERGIRSNCRTLLAGRAFRNVSLDGDLRLLIETALGECSQL